MHRANKWGCPLGATVATAVMVALGGVPGTARGAGENVPKAAADLQTTFQGARVHLEQGRVRALYGRPMTEAATPQLAADRFVRDHFAAFGVEGVTLNQTDSGDLSFGRFTVFTYEQTMDGLPVEHGLARVLVLNGAPNAVVYAGARLATRPADGFRPDTVDAKAALANLKARDAYKALNNWYPPELVVLFEGEQGELPNAVRAWKIRAHNDDLADYHSYTFFVNAADGALVRVRDEVYTVDVNGHVNGNATPGTTPDGFGNPPVSTPMPNLNVSISGGNSSVTNLLGDFTILHGGTSAVTVSTGVAGPWVSVNNVAGAEITASTSVTPPGPANLLLNSLPGEQTTAQVNGFLQTTITHNFFKDRRPSWTNLDIPLPCNVNINDVCNAYYTFPDSINFYLAGGGCANTAFSSVVHHEFGHWVVAELGLSQGAFGEGFGDCVSELILNDGIIGRNFCGTGCNVRNIPVANQQYPCSSGAIHTCGQILAGVFWDMNLNFQATYGAGPGLDAVRQLFVDWSAITNGGQGLDSAHPQTAIEVLTVDDNDGILENGTPNYDDICDAFSQHNIPCPEISGILFEFPNGLPETVTPNQVATIRVDALAAGDMPVPGSGTVSYRVDGGAFTTVPMDELIANEYEADLPGADCPSRIDYYFTVDLAGGGSETSPADAPASYYSTSSGTGIVNVVTRDFEVSPGWAVSGTATDGQWSRGVPIGGGDRGDPPSDFDGSGQCWLTDNVDGNSDVDGGSTILTSEVFDLSGMLDPKLSYARWYNNTAGDAPASDTFVIEISDNGSTWVNLETVGPSGSQVSGGWFERTFYVSDFVNLTSTVQVRFNASDLGAGSVVEAAVDALSIDDVDECPAVGGPCGDFDNDGDVDTADFAMFGQCFGGSNQPPAASCPDGVDADCDDDGDVDTGDFAIFSQNFTGSM